MTALLETRKLEAFYGQTRALHGLDFSLDEGSVTTILGANGAGKTTTLRALCGMIRTAGEVGLLPISPAQFEMLVDGNTCDAARFWADFDVPDVPFTPEHLGYLRDG